MTELTEHDWIQVEMAARGCVSGTLEEWPHLARALKRLGHEDLPSTTWAGELRRLCQLAMGARHEAGRAELAKTLKPKEE